LQIIENCETSNLMKIRAMGAELFNTDGRAERLDGVAIRFLQCGVFSTEYIYVFCVDLRANSDYFPIQH